ncbi:hypothetical protein GCM10009557_09800 [Virgisporangium ochraceum]|uniref:Twin-arginine translocation signal domain-containing protein n=1 Tax=Virgisporangium ochraceum TaxID=65505 RepID=A0A8J3ZXE5_9ACTN|nr:hypothetical protein [Virgisporangium ochraceum]GIJ71371.1 hypothetical protein Voc01_062880 [Virgisporangium ochraceum]
MSDGSIDKKAGQVRRRRLLGGVGASGIAAAITVFGRSGPAAAVYNVACCHLAMAPTKTISQCLAASHYVWHCWHAGYVRCQCCEIKNSSGTYTASAYSCN